ncbi:hypothetical protein NMY22_g15662 [Coprinellus aureogranulatus]|nr:hypothetical protein NMY22_g15662 [Coprinellus aureogranulatus]
MTTAKQDTRDLDEFELRGPRTRPTRLQPLLLDFRTPGTSLPDIPLTVQTPHTTDSTTPTSPRTLSTHSTHTPIETSPSPALALGPITLTRTLPSPERARIPELGERTGGPLGGRRGEDAMEGVERGKAKDGEYLEGTTTVNACLSVSKGWYHFEYLRKSVLTQFQSSTAQKRPNLTEHNKNNHPSPILPARTPTSPTTKPSPNRTDPFSLTPIAFTPRTIRYRQYFYVERTSYLPSTNANAIPTNETSAWRTLATPNTPLSSYANHKRRLKASTFAYHYKTNANLPVPHAHRTLDPPFNSSTTLQPLALAFELYKTSEGQYSVCNDTNRILTCLLYALSTPRPPFRPSDLFPAPELVFERNVTSEDPIPTVGRPGRPLDVVKDTTYGAARASG